MAKEKLTPPVRPMPCSGGFKDGGQSTLTTPKNHQGEVWNHDKEQTNKMFGK